MKRWLVSEGMMRVVVVGLVLLVGVLIVSNVYVYWQGRQFYRQFQRTRLDPIGLRAFMEDVVVPEGDKQVVVFLGDSRAAGWQAPAGFTTTHQFINRGIGGETSHQTLLRFDTHITPLEPDIIVLQVGVNELTAIPLLRHREAEIRAESEANIRELVARCRALGATVIWTTIFPAGQPQFNDYLRDPGDIASAINTVNGSLSDLAGEGVIVFDTSAVLAGEDGRVLDGLAADFLHLNPAGYAALNIELTKLLQRTNP